jgi:hypothetical protein
VWTRLDVTAGLWKVSTSAWSRRLSGDKALESPLIEVVVFPVAEVGDEVLANLAGGIFAGVGVEALPVAQGFEGREADGEQDSALVAQFALASLGVYPRRRKIRGPEGSC